MYGTEVELSSIQIYWANESTDVGFDDSKWTYVKDRLAATQAWYASVGIVTVGGTKYVVNIPNEACWSTTLPNQWYSAVKDFPVNGAAMFMDIDTGLWAFTLPKLVFNKGDIIILCGQGAW